MYTRLLSVFSLSLALFSPAFAQNNTNLQAQAIQAHFLNAHIVPELLSSFNPTAILSLNFPGVGDVNPGQLLTRDQTGPTPAVTISPVESSDKFDGTYTIIMVDADIVDADLSQGENRHWLLNGVKITNGKIDNSSATAITPYAGPGPAAGSGPHRYTVILYQQPSTFSAPTGFTGTLGVSKMNLDSYVKDSNLGPLVAANYFQVQEGTPTVSLHSTSAVATSSLPAAAFTGSTSRSSGGAAASSTGASGVNTGGAMTLARSPAILVAIAGLSTIFLL